MCIKPGGVKKFYGHDIGLDESTIIALIPSIDIGKHKVISGFDFYLITYILSLSYRVIFYMYIMYIILYSIGNCAWK